MFIHLENEQGVIVAQRDVYLKEGLQATHLLQPNDDWLNPIAIRIPDYAYAPQRLNVYLGFYDASITPSDRLIPVGPNVTDDSRIYLGSVDLVNLAPRLSTLNFPNP